MGRHHRQTQRGGDLRAVMTPIVAAVLGVAASVLLVRLWHRSCSRCRRCGLGAAAEFRDRRMR
jgi:hypothetical protein